MKLNIGSHNKKMEGYINVDGLDLENVDVVHDYNNYPSPFEDDTVDEIYTCEFLEHLSFRKTFPFLRDCYRILKKGGEIKIQVPDIGMMCKYYVNGQICDCVPRKAEKMSEYKAQKGCKKCQGRALIHHERWKFALAGAQKHEYDAHLNHFTEGELLLNLRTAGFRDMKTYNNLYKLIIHAKKPL